jgi:DNA-binding transcriptional ArsR family regulator
MRPAKAAQSAFRAPLNAILGTEANVRVLRELVLAGIPLTRSEIARRSGLSLPGAAGALEKLQDAGIVEPAGGGSRPAVQLRAGHPLRTILQALFHQEASRLPALMDDMRALVSGLDPLPRAAWIEGPVAEGADHSGEPLVLGFLAGARDVSRLATAMQGELARIERDYDVTVEVRGRTEADIATLGAVEEQLLRGAQGLMGPHPTAYLDQRQEDHTGGKVPRASASHARYDYQAMVTASWIAQRLDRDPSLPRRARSWLVHRLHDASEREAEELNEWVRLLDTASIPRLQYVLRDAGERSTRLRQSNPFVPVLTEAERTAMREEVGR